MRGDDPRNSDGGHAGGVDAVRASSVIGRNTLLNLLGTGLPILLALATVPVLIHGAGAERFGVLTLAWAVLGYFGLFDLGLGRATIRFLAEAFERQRVVESRGIFWTSVFLSGLFGTISACALAALTPWLVDAVLNVPSGLLAETRGAFYLLALGVPPTVLTAAFRGTLEAKHRFGLVNGLQAPNAVLTQAAPLIVLIFSQDLRWLVGAMVLSRMWAAGVFFVAALRNLENPFEGPFFMRERLRTLLSYSSWQAVTNTVSPLMVSADRFVIGAVSSMTAVAYYATPAEIVSRLLIVPQSLGRTTFPIFSSGVDTHQRTRVYVGATRHLILVLAPLAASLVAFAPDLLSLWVGSSFARNGASVLQILAIGFLLNSLAILPFGLIQGMGRPDVTAKFHLLELPLYLLCLWYAVQIWGIGGAAFVWTVRVGVDFALLTFYTWITKRVDRRRIESERLHLLLGVSLLLIVAGWFVDALISQPLLKLGVWSLLLGAMAYLTWKQLLTTAEKGRVAGRFARDTTVASEPSLAGQKGPPRDQ